MKIELQMKSVSFENYTFSDRVIIVALKRSMWTSDHNFFPYEYALPTNSSAIP